MHLFMIRHGQSTNNAIAVAEPGDAPAEGGSPTSDPELTSIGRRQADLVARFLAESDGRIDGGDSPCSDGRGFRLTHLYTSLMARAVATAEAISETVDLAPVAWPEVHEWGGLYRRDGTRAGLPGPGRSFFAESSPRLVLPDWLDDEGWWNRPHEDEPAMVVRRAERFTEQLVERHGASDNRVAVVSHGGFFRALRRVLLGTPLGTPPFGHPDEPRPGTYNTSISCFQWGANGESRHPRGIYMNRVDHLPPELVT